MIHPWEAERKTRVGRVVSAKMQKTVVVQVETLRLHPRYHRVIKHRTKFMAHDAQGECHLGDLVRIVETRPLSRLKRWRVAEILAQGRVAEVRPQEIGAELERPAASPSPSPAPVQEARKP